jgi:hypothetical protein
MWINHLTKYKWCVMIIYSQCADGCPLQPLPEGVKRRRTMKKQAFSMFVVLITVATFFCGCPQTPVTTMENPVTVENPATLTISGNLFESLNSDKNLSAAGQANLIYEMALAATNASIYIDEFVDGNWTGRTRKNENVVITNGAFEVSFLSIETGYYKIRCSIETENGGRCLFLYSEDNLVAVAGTTSVSVELQPMSFWRVGAVIHNLPGDYASRILWPGQCYLVDDQGNEYEVTVPGGSGQGIWNIGLQYPLLLCVDVCLPLETEIVEFKITDDTGVLYSLPISYNGFDWLEGTPFSFTFPDAANLDVDFNIDLQTPPTLILETTEEYGYYNASFTPGDFYFTGEEWVYSKDGGDVADGFTLKVVSGVFTGTTNGDVFINGSDFSLYWETETLGERLPVDCHDIRVVVDGITLMPSEFDGSLGYECGWMIPVTE